jgi:hypothetical protein
MDHEDVYMFGFCPWLLHFLCYDYGFGLNEVHKTRIYHPTDHSPTIFLAKQILTQKYMQYTNKNMFNIISY